jgi:hypothetical protein
MDAYFPVFDNLTPADKAALLNAAGLVFPFPGSRSDGRDFKRSIAPFGIALVLIVKVNAVIRRCLDRSSDWSEMFKSVFSLISEIAVFNALWRKFAQIGNGGSWMVFPEDMKITGPEWEAFMDDFQQTLDKFSVPAQEQAELKAIVESTRADIVVSAIALRSLGKEEPFRQISP